MPLARTDAGIDWLVITAASRAQASGYRSMLRERAACGLLKGVRRWLVVPDPKDVRAGSGNATLVAMARVLAARLAELHRQSKKPRTLDDLLIGQRVIVIHSGGDSRRLPSYAACGKLFLPLDRRLSDGRSATMFDLILADLIRVHVQGAPEGTTLVASGDVLLNASAHSIDLCEKGVVGVAFAAAPEVAAKHGVYVRGSGDRVTQFLQKPTEEELRRQGAMTEDGRALVDSGLVSADGQTMTRLLWAFGLRLEKESGRLRLSGEFARIVEARAKAMDLYQDVLMAASGSPAGPPSLQKALAGIPFRVRVIPSCDFLHIGTTSQLLSIAAKDPRVRDGVSPRRSAVVLASPGAGKLRAASDCWIDACSFHASATLPGENVLVGVDVRRSVKMPRGWGVVVVPLSNARCVPIAFGINDDFKLTAERGGTFGGKSLADLVERVPDPHAVWRAAVGGAGSIPCAERTLYHARVWPVVGKGVDAIEAVRWMWTIGARPSNAWIRSRHISVAEAMNLCDRAAIVERRRVLASHAAGESHPGKGDGDVGTTPIADLTPEDAARMLLRHTRAAWREGSPTRRASALWISSEIARVAGRDPAPLEKAALQAVAEAVSLSARAARSRDRTAVSWKPLLPEQASWASAPARIDLAGGWSDTPPICHDLGGAVVNAAVRVGGRAAVHAIVRRTERSGLTITSTDLGRTTRIRHVSRLAAPFDATDWSALSCAAIGLSAGSDRRPRSIEEVTERFWRGPGGLHVTTFSTLPKGSGLGTSSILGATVLAALANACGSTPSVTALSARTLTLEQMLGTGGGWQDQAGGLSPGVKFLTTAPGDLQVPRTTPLAQTLFTSPDGPQMLLYFTGVRRMARDILHGVVGRYLARNAATLRAIHALKAGASAMADAVTRGDQAEFCARLAEYWTLKRDIDPGAAHPAVDAAISLVQRDLLAWELPGAGGGGFLFMIARDPGATARVQRTLTRYAPNEQARFADVSVDPTGLRVIRT